MKFYTRWMTAAMLLALVATGVVVSAQEKSQDKEAAAKQKAESNVIVQRGGEFMFAGQASSDGAGPQFWFGGGEGNAVFVASEMLMGKGVVKGAPYSAQGVTESIQTFADGNRIVRRSTATVYRDSEGRTRNEQPLGDFGPYATANEPSQLILINDPVESTHYTLDPRTKTARKMTFVSVKTKMGDVSNLTGDQAGVAALKAQVELRAAEGQQMRTAMPKIGMAMSADGATFNVKLREPKIEKLGKQTIEGVEAEGERATITIPAGEIGNEQPIQIVSENWYSPELQVTVMSRHSDPRMGETTYKLANINRAEQPHSLFEVPSDYTIKEMIDQKVKMMLDRELQRARKPADKQDN